MVKRTLAAPDAAEIETQNGKVPMHKGVIELVDNLVIHCPAKLRVRMQNDGDRRVFLSRRVVATLDPARGASEDDLGHEHLWVVEDCDAVTARLTERAPVSI